MELIRVHPSSEWSHKGGMELHLGGTVMRSSLWIVWDVPGTPRRAASATALLKAGYGPLPEEDVSGSSTSTLCRSPCGVMDATTCVVGGVREMVFAMWRLPYSRALPLPLPRIPLLSFPFFEL